MSSDNLPRPGGDRAQARRRSAERGQTSGVGAPSTGIGVVPGARAEARGSSSRGSSTKRRARPAAQGPDTVRIATAATTRTAGVTASRTETETEDEIASPRPRASCSRSSAQRSCNRSLNIPVPGYVGRDNIGGASWTSDTCTPAVRARRTERIRSILHGGPEVLADHLKHSLDISTLPPSTSPRLRGPRTRVPARVRTLGREHEHELELEEEEEEDEEDDSIEEEVFLLVPTAAMHTEFRGRVQQDSDVELKFVRTLIRETEASQNSALMTLTGLKIHLDMHREVMEGEVPEGEVHDGIQPGRMVSVGIVELEKAVRKWEGIVREEARR